MGSPSALQATAKRNKEGFGLLFQKTMGLGGASALAVAANIFLGMIESPIVIRAYLDKLTRSELFLMMVVGLATVAGSTMVAYAAILKDVLPNAAAHVITASIISARVTTAMGIRGVSGWPPPARDPNQDSAHPKHAGVRNGGLGQPIKRAAAGRRGPGGLPGTGPGPRDC